MKDILVKAVATGFYSGYLRPFPGTWGTIPAWLIAYYAVRGDTPILAALTVVTVFVSIWAASQGEKIFGHDGRKIVIDEWAGMFVTLLFVPYTPGNYIAGFLAFRILDVAKIPPARQSEKLRGGWGVTADDIIAGLQANIVIQILLWFGVSLELPLPFLY